MPIKILNIIDSLNAGGAESLLKNFVIESKKYNNFQIEICTLYSNKFFEEEIKKNNISIYNLNLKFKYDLSGILKIIKLIRKEKFSIVHVHLFPANIFVAISSFFLPKNIKFIFTEHSTYNRRRSHKIFKLVDKFIYNRYSKIICISKQVEKALLEWLPTLKEKTIVIPNGIPIPNLPNDQVFKIYDILLVGRLEKVKGIDVFLKAVNILKNRQQKKIKIAIAGDGSLKNNLKELAQKLKIDNEINFLGVRKDIDKLMYSSKILVLPSRYEGFGLVIVEAMSRGLPVVATSVGGIPDIIENNKDGLLISPENPEELAKAINRLLDNKNLREELAKNAYKKVKENFSIEIYTKKILNLYKSLL